MRTASRLAVLGMLALGALIGGWALLTSPASATHLTSVTLTPETLTAAAGTNANFSGVVGADCDQGGPEDAYGWTLSATGAPAGSTYTFTPASQAPEVSDSTNYTLSVALPPGAAAGAYTVTVTATYVRSSDCLLTDGETQTDSSTLTVTRQGDLVTSKTDNQTTDAPGTSIQYIILVQNNGPSTATNATVQDTFPVTVSNVTWTCQVLTSGSTCPGGGTGNINAPVTLAPGGQVRFTANGMIGTTASGTLSNTATVIAPSGFTETNASNNSSTDTTTLQPQGDLSITKTDGATEETPGTTVTYTIVARNTGPSTVVGATVTDTFPAPISNVQWTCMPSLGSSCPGGGTGNIAAPVTLTPNGTATFSATGTISPQASGTLSNTASIAAPPNFTDTNPNNNSATDTDTLAVADLAVSKSCAPGSVLPGDQFSCTITVANTGNAPASTVSVTDDLPDGVTLVGAPAGAGYSCGMGDPFTCTRPSIAGGEATTITYTVRVDDDVNGGSSFTNNAAATTVSPEPDTSDNTATATTSTPTCTIDRTTASGPQTIRGTAGPDVICGSAFSDSIQGLDGDDIIFGNGGNDSIQGNGGNDRLFGGAGDDSITGPPGTDAANGGSGNDACVAAANTACERARVA